MAENANKHAKTVEELIAIAISLGWAVTPSLFDGEEHSYMFSKFSPAGQDFNFEIMADDLIGNLEHHINGFDVSSETYIWLDQLGHGKNGAPHDMKDIYEDMEACKEMMLELLAEWKTAILTHKLTHKLSYEQNS